MLLRLPYEVKDLFKEWLAQHYPQRAEHVMSLVRDARGGRENDPNFGSRMRGTGAYAELLRARFQGRRAPARARFHARPSPRHHTFQAARAPAHRNFSWSSEPAHDVAEFP